jgi:hypothetical protein
MDVPSHNNKAKLMNASVISIAANLLLATPISESGYTWTLASRLGDMLHLAQEHFGQRDLSYTMLGVEFTAAANPQIWYPGGAERKCVIIQVTLSGLTNPLQVYYQMAHECIHLLSPTIGQGASLLEEGLATHFAAFYMRERIGAASWHSKMQSYVDAQEKVEELLRLDRDAIKRLRAVQPHISSISADLIRSHYPMLPNDLSEQLAARFVRDMP